MTRRIHIEKSSGNVFADLGVPEPQEALAKAELARKIADIIARKKMTQVQVAQVLGVDQPKVSALVRGRLTDFSVERLMRFLTALGQDVEIVVKRHRRARGAGRIRVAASG